MEDMNAMIEKVMTAAAAPEDYYDEEGLLCCGKCHTRKEVITEKPIILCGQVYDRHPCMCRCKKEQFDKGEAERILREHQQCVERLKSVCFTSPARREHTFANATMLPPDIREKAKRYVDDWATVKKENTGLLAWGNCGTGKSYTAACIANALMEQEVPVLMRNMGDFMNAGFEDKEEFCRDIARYDLVIIDDLGMERGTEYGLEMVYRIINTRYESGKPTIFTTNLSLQELKFPVDMAHKRIYDRVLEMTVPLRFSGPNVRPEIHQKKMNIFRRFFQGGK